MVVGRPYGSVKWKGLLVVDRPYGHGTVVDT